MRLSKLYLFEEYSGRDIGGRLLTFVEDEAGKPASASSSKVNGMTSARQFYLGHGHSVEERIDCMRVVMRRRLQI